MTTDFNYVGNQVFHSSDSTLSNSSETLYSLLVALNQAIANGDSSAVLLLEREIEMSTIQTSVDKIDYILKLILAKIIGTDSYSLLMYQLVTEYILDNSSGKLISMPDLFTKLSKLNIDFSNEETLYNNYVSVTIPKGNSDQNIQIIADQILTVMSPNEVIQNISDGAKVNILNNQALSDLQALMAEFSNTNYSLDYILSILKARLDAILASLRQANAVMMSNISSSMGNKSLSGYLNYGNSLSALEDSSTFGTIALIKDSSQQILSQIYSASDGKVPNRLDLSEGLSDIIHTTDSTVFMMNYDYNLSVITNSHMNVYLYLMSIHMINMSFSEFDGNYKEIMTSILPRLNSGTLEYQMNNFNLGMSGIAKTNNHIPYDKEALSGIHSYMSTAQSRVTAYGSEINGFFISGSNTTVGSLNGIIDKLGAVLTSAFGSNIAIIQGLLVPLRLAVTAINLVLCVVKAFLCAIASVINTITKALGVSTNYYNSFMDIDNSAETSLFNLSKMKDQFMGDCDGSLSSALKNGMSPINDEILSQLTIMGVSPDLIAQAKGALSGCSDTSITSYAHDTISSYVTGELNNAYQGAMNMATSIMSCPSMNMPSGKFTLPKIKDVNAKLNMPDLGLGLGC